LRALGAERLGHGVRAIEDPYLVEYLVANRIGLEVCPISNVQLGAFPSLAEHPLPQLLAAGAVVTVNTDTPAIFGTTLTDELVLLETAYGLAPPTIDEVLLNGFEQSFLPSAEKEALLRSVRAELEGLRGAALEA
jgi:adenosine deaminase